MICQHVTPPTIPAVWPRVSDWISAAIEKGDRWWSLDSLRHRLEIDPDAGLFLAIDQSGIYGACVIIIEDQPNGERVAYFPALGGKDFRRWRHLLPEIEAWAKQRGASSIKVTGRLGWRRALIDTGYRQTAIITEKPL